jgi:hypothetical protein
LNGLCLCLLALSLAQTSGGPFRNLDFEEVNTNAVAVTLCGFPTYCGYGPVEELLPGWKLYFRTNLLTIIGYNHPGDGGSFPTIVTKEEQIGFLPNSIAGKFGLYIAPGTDSPFTLTQEGEIPANAQILTAAGGARGFMPIQLMVNGTPLILSTALRGWDVSAFAGQTVELEFLFDRNPNFESPVILIDSFSFVVPNVAIVRSGATVTVSWPFLPTGFVVESTSDMSAMNWPPLLEVPIINNHRWEVTLPVSLPYRYFRLHKP